MKAQGSSYIDFTPNVSLISVVTDQTHPPTLDDDAAATEWANALLYTLPLQNDPDAGIDPADPWLQLALSIVQQSLKDAALGDYDALAWLIQDGRVWLDELGISPLIVDSWVAKL